MLPSPQELKIFLEAAESLNFSRASEKVGITQSALSQAIKRLEENIGLELFVRQKSGVYLTRAGEKLYTQVNFLLEQWEHLRGQTQLENTEVTGLYKMGMHESVSLYTLKHFIYSLVSDFPQLELNFIHSNSRSIVDQILSSQLHFAIVINPVKHPDLVMHKLCEDTVSVWYHPNCEHLDTLVYTPEMIQTQTILRKLKGKKNPFRRFLKTASFEVAAEICAQGAAMAVLPTRVADKYSDIVVEKEKFPIFKDQIYLVYRYDNMNTPAAKKLITTLREKLKYL